jgi:hypothetical protein
VTILNPEHDTPQVPDEDTLLTKLSVSELPWHLHNGIVRWVCYGIRPGGFLTSVFSNDLFGAVMKADSESFKALPDLVRWLHWSTPPGCRGSEKAMDTWVLFIKALENQGAKK